MQQTQSSKGDITYLTDMVDFCAMFHRHWIAFLKSHNGGAIEHNARTKILPIYCYGVLEFCYQFDNWDKEHTANLPDRSHPSVDLIVDILRKHGEIANNFFKEFHADEILALTYFRHHQVHVNISAHRNRPLQAYEPTLTTISHSKTSGAQENMSRVESIVNSHGGLPNFFETVFARFREIETPLWAMIGDVLIPHSLQPVIRSANAGATGIVPAREVSKFRERLISVDQRSETLSATTYFDKIYDGGKEL
jgi:hypothetical protein